MENNKQTWWDKEIKNQFNDFKSWVGKSNAQSKVVIRDFIIKEGYKSIIDFGCGLCDDYFEYKKIPITWTGIEGSEFLYKHTQVQEIPVIKAEAHKTGLPDQSAEVAYSRHVLEHQRYYEPILTEMIRVASKMVIHIFFISPRDKEIINFQENTNLYHNTFDRNEIFKFLEKHIKVKGFKFQQITSTEEALIINLK